MVDLGGRYVRARTWATGALVGAMGKTEKPQALPGTSSAWAS